MSDQQQLSPQQRANVATAAYSLGPNGEPPTSAHNPAVVLIRYSRHRRRWVRCSIKSMLISGSSAT